MRDWNKLFQNEPKWVDVFIPEDQGTRCTEIMIVTDSQESQTSWVRVSGGFTQLARQLKEKAEQKHLFVSVRTCEHIDPSQHNIIIHTQVYQIQCLLSEQFYRTARTSSSVRKLNARSPQMKKLFATTRTLVR